MNRIILTPRRFVTLETILTLYPFTNLGALPSRTDNGVMLYDSMSAYEQHTGTVPLVEAMLNIGSHPRTLPDAPASKPKRKARGEPTRNVIARREVCGKWCVTGLWLEQKYGIKPHSLQELAGDGKIERVRVGRLNWYDLASFESYRANRKPGRPMGTKDKKKRKRTK